jgi:hypothetical protein
MAGSLIKIDEEIVTSAVASVTLTGIDSTYDVYMVKVVNCTPDTDGVSLQFRVTESGTPNSTANYDYAMKNLRAAASFSNGSATNQTNGLITAGLTGSGTNETANSIMYIFNANNASEYTFTTTEASILSNTAELRGAQGGNVFTSASVVNGIQIFFGSGNIESATSLSLYGLKK